MASRALICLVLPLTLGLGTGALAGCDSEPDPAEVGEQADGTAAALVEALANGDISQVPFVEMTGAEAAADLTAVVKGMGDIVPAVRLGDVEESGDQASATVTWTWPLTPSDAWSYDVVVELERVGDDWSVVWQHSLIEPTLNAASVLDASAVEAKRGDITGAGGVKLVAYRDVVKVGIDRTLVPAAKTEASARALAQLVDVDPAAFAERVEAAGEKAFVEAITLRESDVPGSLAGDADQIRGARLLRDKVPLAPTRDFAAPILGSVGEVTAEMIEESPEAYALGDVAGLSGLQARYDSQLRGTPGMVVNARGSDGKQRELFRVDARRGGGLSTTLDPELQRTAEALLAAETSASAVVAIKPSTGAILAAANGPGNGGQNLATFGQYAPGSTFKSVSSLALLRAGIKPDTTVECTTTVDVDGRDFENYDDYPSSGLGRIPFSTAVANSCNTAFIAERGRLKDQDLAAAAASLGLGVDHDLGFPAYFGQVAPPTTETGRAADMIGQGTVLASPMVMAAVIASIQNGTMVIPRLLDEMDVRAPDGVTPVSSEEAAALRDLLRGVVTSGSGRLLRDVPGPAVIAKTGTAEYDAGDGDIRTHAWMIAAQGDLAVAVFVGDGPSGSGTAGPILEQFLRAAG
ncbi:MAG: penicillin-binding transpeptidase domain-containing protein [Nocardioides sp.]